MGGLSSEVDYNTKNILIESAIFNPYNVRYTSINEELRSEASLRYEKDSIMNIPMPQWKERAIYYKSMQTVK